LTSIRSYLLSRVTSSQHNLAQAKDVVDADDF